MNYSFNYKFSYNHNQLPALDNLPYELYQILLKFVDLEDLLELRSVCKKLNQIISEFKIEEMIFSDLDYHNDFNWFYINRPMYYKNMIDISTLFLLSTSLINVQHLKCLCIDNIETNELFDLDKLNKFKQLEHLTLKLELPKFKEIKKRLSLPNLKSLSLYCQSFTNEKIEIAIETSKLRALNLNDHLDLSYFKFIHPLTINYLKLNYYESYIEIFKNLEYLECSNVFDKGSILLSAFSNLKEIKIRWSIPIFLPALLTEISRLERETKVYLKGVELKTGEEFNGYNNQNELDFQMNHYRTLSRNLDYDNLINYSKLMELVSVIPEDFFRKYINIQKVQTDKKVENQDNLIKFIKKCSNLRELSLRNSKLNQSFYDELHLICSLIDLRIDEDTDLKLNFEFINKIYYLVIFETNQQLDLNENHRLDQLNYLNRIEFKITDHQISIDKLMGNKYEFDNEYYSDDKLKRLTKYKMNFNDLIKWCTLLKVENEGPITRSKFKKLKTKL